LAGFDLELLRSIHLLGQAPEGWLDALKPTPYGVAVIPASPRGSLTPCSDDPFVVLPNQEIMLTGIGLPYPRHCK
jgi:hypothetical protein